MKKKLTKLNIGLFTCLILIIFSIIYNLFKVNNLAEVIFLIISNVVLFILVLKIYKVINKKEELVKLFDDTKNMNLEDKITKIINSYYFKTSKEKFLTEKRLNDLVVDIDKVSLISLVFFTIPLIIGAITPKESIASLVFFSVLYVVLAYYICLIVKRYRFYKIYLSIITDLRDKKIKITEKEEIKKDIELHIDFDMD